MNNRDTLWKQPVIERFKALLQDRPWRSYSKIAQILTNEFDAPFTKNACISKAKRNGFAPLRMHPKLRGRRGEYIIAPPVIRPQPRRRTLMAKIVSHVTIWHLEPQHCRWPLGAINDHPPYLYCGEPKLADCPYCFSHAQIAFPALRRVV